MSCIPPCFWNCLSFRHILRKETNHTVQIWNWKRIWGYLHGKFLGLLSGNMILKTKNTIYAWMKTITWSTFIKTLHFSLPCALTFKIVQQRRKVINTTTQATPNCIMCFILPNLSFNVSQTSNKIHKITNCIVI